MTRLNPVVADDLRGGAFKKKGKKGKRSNMLACTCAGIMAAATLRDLYRSGMANHASVAFFFVLFSLKKSFVEDWTSRKI